ncbi:hypothetical protein GOODEAATRI_013922, partial [Goodea atripinnis]
YLIGYISHQKPMVESDCGQSVTVETSGTNRGKPSPAQTVPPPDVSLSWKDVTQLLTDKLSSEAFKKTLKEFDLLSRTAGSEGDLNLANRIFTTFKTLEMKPWTDIHYVQLPMPDSNNPNTVDFGSDVKPAGYLAYSKPGRVEGRLVYGNYGRQEDLDFVQGRVDLKGSVLLLRAGKITFAQQVDNAARMGASAVLIYLDTKDYNLVTDTELYGHVHLGSGDPYTPGFPSFNHTQFAPTESAGLPKIPAQTITANTAAALLRNIGGPEVDASTDFKGELKSVTYKLGGSQNITVERDAWGRGYTRATVGTSVLIELANAFHEMVKKDEFRPKRSIIFASWTAGEFGSVGATEWLEVSMPRSASSMYEAMGKNKWQTRV